MNLFPCHACKRRLPVLCFYGSAHRSTGIGSACRGCSKAQASAWRLANRDRHNDSRRGSNARNAEKIARWRQENKAVIAACMARWQKANPARCRAAGAARRALCVIPAWADLDAIEAIYQLAIIAKAHTGIDWQVDHIVPLNGKGVRGLHVETNLQLLTASANAAKGNRHWPEENCHR